MALAAPAWSCSSLPFCDEMPLNCVASDETETGSNGAGGSEDTLGDVDSGETTSEGAETDTDASESEDTAFEDMSNYYGTCDDENDCFDMEHCLHPSNVSGTVCGEACDMDADCPDLPGFTVECTTFDSVLSNCCFITCSDDNDCPSGMSCETVGLESVCLWP
ncbi:hypothetical protein G6O69_25350 [Pseudenhygromyxa sp. WMMC2535]|uniref:hypothetical protein n=1 Tax=Pseudenhygromyxa sp. WMMC2535 TaxID=2712867 RepID=UPI001554012B|nr:hypothetical protein [Pseudenhygromyxa sp. WMMC2535]NVB41191.1 hypothetical protein [Pseudenhygromyxa sp. WMMC2535]